MIKNKANQEETMQKKKILSPKLDVIFQALFGEVGSERITKKFLEAILGQKLEEVDLTGNIVLRRENLEDKMGVLDVLVKINNDEYCNVEMQMVEKDKLLERILYYWSRIYAKNLKSGNDYENLKKTIEVLIVNFEINKLKELEYHSKWKIIEEKERKLILTEDLEIHIIELPKIYKLKGEEQEEELIKWLNFIENPESKKVEKYMEDNKEMKEAKEKLEVMSEDERMQILAELREKAIRDEKAERRFAERKGRELGREEGLEEGKKLGIKETAKKMKTKGIQIEIIEEITNLTKDEINAL